MGDPKKLKKKFFTSSHPWNKSEIEENKKLKMEYGVFRRKEILIAASFLKKKKDMAKKLLASTTAQAEKEKKQVLDKLQRMGLLSSTANLEQILGLGVKDVLERRSQSLVFRKGLARTMKQARQFITHRHIKVGSSDITSPSTLLSLKEEAELIFKDQSSLADETHPERRKLEVSKEKEIKVNEDKKEKGRAKERGARKEQRTRGGGGRKRMRGISSKTVKGSYKKQTGKRA